MKRIIPLILCIVLFVSCVNPVFASSVDDSLIDLFDYQESDSVFIGGTDTFSYNFTIPTTSFYYFDAVVRSSIPDFSVTVDGFSCQVLPIYGQYYRIVWSGSTSGSSIPIIFNGSGYFFVNIVRAQISTVPFTPIPESLTFNGYNSVHNRSAISGTLSPGSPVILPHYPDALSQADVFELHDFALTIYPSNWQNYDKMNIYLNLNVVSIDSILALVNDQNILSNVSYIDNSDFIEDESSEVNKNNTSHFMIITLDLSAVDHSSSNSAFINISGKYVVTQYSDDLGKIIECNGFLLNKDSDAPFYWFRKIWNAIKDLGQGDSTSQDSADSFNDSVVEQDKELEEMAGIMDSVSKPEISDINMDVGGMVDTSVVTLTTSGISGILSNEIIIRVLLIAFTFGMIGFILYGKK